jgi:hypothetical protein
MKCGLVLALIPVVAGPFDCWAWGATGHEYGIEEPRQVCPRKRSRETGRN